MKATLKAKYGRVRIYVPKRLSADHTLVVLIGMAAAEKLVKRFGGEDHFDIPKAQAVGIALRNTRIKQEYATPSQRQVRKILGSEKPKNYQMGLFN